MGQPSVSWPTDSQTTSVHTGPVFKGRSISTTWAKMALLDKQVCDFDAVSGAPWPAAPGPAAAATNGEALFLDYCNSLLSLGDVQRALKNHRVHGPELIEFPKRWGTFFRMGRSLQRMRGNASETDTQAQRATSIFSVVREYCYWSDDATLQEKLDAGSKLFQAKSRYHPALHRYLQELLGFLEMAAEVCSEAEKQHAAEGSGSGEAFRAAPAAVRSLIDRGESNYSERVFLANLSEDDFVAHCQGFQSVSQVQIALGLRRSKPTVVDCERFFNRAKIAFQCHG